MIILIVFLFFTVLLSIFIISPIRTKIIYQRRGEDDYAGVELFLIWNLLPVRIEITALQGPRRILEPLLRIKGKVTSKGKKPVTSRKKAFPPSEIYRQAVGIWQYFNTFKPVIKYALKKSKVIDLRWKTTLGFENAGITGIVTGALWTFKGLSAATLYQVTGQQKNLPQLAIHPVYNKEVLDTEFLCIFEIRPGHIIISLLKVIKLWLYKRMNPGSEKHARTASN